MWFSFNFFLSVWDNPVALPFTTFLDRSLELQEMNLRLLVYLLNTVLLTLGLTLRLATIHWLLLP